MRKKKKAIGRVVLSLILGIGASVFFLWPFSSPIEAAGESAQTAPALEAPAEPAAAETPTVLSREAGEAESAPAAQEAAPRTEPEKPAESIQEPAPEPTAEPAPEPMPTMESPTPQHDANAEKIRVSELMVKNRATLPDEDGDFPDWIELENISGETVELTGWLLRDSGRGDGWTLPETRLEPGQRLLIFASGKDRPGHASFALSGGESLEIFTANGTPVQSLLCPDGEADRSWLPDGEGGWQECLYPTPGLPNTAESYDALMAQRVTASPLVINEVCTYNKTARWKGQVGISDWIELKNVSDTTLELSDYYVSDQVDQRLLYRLPEKSLAPGEFFLLMCNTEESLLGAAPLCMEFALDSTADRVYLSRADGELADYVSLRAIPYNASYGRLPGQNGWFFLPEPSPGSNNGYGARRVSESPVSLTPDGVYNDVDAVTVSLEGKGVIRYTVDGSYPTESSPLYEGPITLTKTGLVRAISVEPGALPSPALTLSFLLNENHVLPVMSLVSNDGRLYNLYYNRTKDVEIPCNLAFYEEGGGFNIPCGIKMHGETSLQLPKKNMSVRFRGAYGQEELHYDIFRDGGVCDFTNVLLRGGQDYYHAIIRNELCTELALAVSDKVIVSRNRYCVLYMDGRYMGIYALGEKLNEAMYAHQAGVSRDSVTVETPPLDGKHAMYREVFTYAMNHDLSQPEYYEELCRRLDVDSLIDWLILEGCFANDDLTYGNVRYCRSLEGDGMWHLMFFDLDSTFNHTDTVFANLLSPWARSSRQVAQLINMLLQSPAFRTRLLERASVLIPMLSNERILEEIDRLCAEIDPEVERDYNHNTMYKSEWLWNVDWMRTLITSNDWNAVCIRSFCSYLNVTAEERALYFPGF